MRRSACPGAAIRTAPLGALPPRVSRVAELMRSRLPSRWSPPAGTAPHAVWQV